MPSDLISSVMGGAAASGRPSAGRVGRVEGWRPRISVAIINNMPDLALQATERQFLTHLEAGAEQFDLRVHLFSLPGIARSGAMRDRVKTRYLDYACLRELHMDALIVTGAVPNAAPLTDEPFWPHMVELAEWASTHTLSVLWSCLSAHAAVLHLDGITRRRLPRKLSGLYSIETNGGHALLAGVDRTIWIPHSRYNDLPEEALRAAGYAILGRSDAVGVDMFMKATPSLFVGLQGHPEYDGHSLMREYRRDLRNILRMSATTIQIYPPIISMRLPSVRCRRSRRRHVRSAARTSPSNFPICARPFPHRRLASGGNENLPQLD